MALKLGSFQGQPTKNIEFAMELDKDRELEVQILDTGENVIRYLSREDMIQLRDHLQGLLDD